MSAKVVRLREDPCHDAGAPISRAVLDQLHALLRLDPIAGVSPARVLFVVSDEARARLARHLAPGAFSELADLPDVDEALDLFLRFLVGADEAHAVRELAPVQAPRHHHDLGAHRGHVDLRAHDLQRLRFGHVGAPHSQSDDGTGRAADLAFDGVDLLTERRAAVDGDDRVARSDAGFDGGVAVDRIDQDRARLLVLHDVDADAGEIAAVQLLVETVDLLR